jgi:hypothetical protein
VLLENCADARPVDRMGKTALKWAQEKRYSQILELLKTTKPCD